MHTVPIEELADLIWAISNTRTPSNLRWIEKAATAVIDRVEEISLKSLAQIVWLTSDYIKSLRKP
jgi:hypothetical protein